MASGMEPRPCMMCRNFEHDSAKLTRHLLAMGLEVDENGVFTTPIAKDIPGRKSLKLDPKSFGYCHNDGVVVDILATCPNWTPVRTASELESRIKP